MKSRFYYLTAFYDLTVTMITILLGSSIIHAFYSAGVRDLTHVSVSFWQITCIIVVLRLGLSLVTMKLP